MENIICCSSPTDGVKGLKGAIKVKEDEFVRQRPGNSIFGALQHAATLFQQCFMACAGYETALHFART